MIKLAWRQSRSQALVALVLVGVVAAVAVATRPLLVNMVAGASASGPLLENGFLVLQRAFVAIVIGAPVLVGVFWGAPLIARELETGTFRLVWTQSVTRARWLGMKLLVVGLAGVVVAGLLSLIVTWWSDPLYHLAFSSQTTPNRFGLFDFGAGWIVPLSYAAFGFMVGATAGLLFRRTLPAMGLAIAAFAVVRITATYWVRPYFMSPVKTNLSLTSSLLNVGVMKPLDGGPVRLEPLAHIPNAWVYSVDIVDNAGHAPSAEALRNAAAGAGRPGAILDNLAATYHAVVTSQPADRFWAFQGIETAVFIALAALLAGLCFWWVRHRIA